MNPAPRGVKTSELWVQVLAIAAVLGLAALGIPVDPTIAALVIGGATAYGVNRTWAKRPVADKNLADRIDKALKRR